MAIIRQSIPLFAVPDFRNLGTCLKVMLLGIFFLLIICFTQSEVDEYFWDYFFYKAVWVCPSLVITVSVLYLMGDFLASNRFNALYLLLVVLGVFGLAEYKVYSDHKNILEHFLSVSFITLFSMHYFALLRKALSPAETEARLAALTARIRPHFLFNSLNAAISLIRSRPSEAEMVLENLATLFRAQLGDHMKPSTLDDEIELAKDYLAIEQIRMGPTRLKTRWKIKAPGDTITPSLLLQPLLENAVYHGIEPIRTPGLISTSVIKVRNWVYITITNPLPDSPKEVTKREGNQMALKNLSERLALMFDQDAILSSSIEDGKYKTKIRIPYRSARVMAVNEYKEQKELKEQKERNGLFKKNNNE